MNIMDTKSVLKNHKNLRRGKNGRTANMTSMERNKEKYHPENYNLANLHNDVCVQRKML